jgi:solute carrier family 50 protein (sugar transporter)
MIFHIPNLLERMIEEPVSVLSVLSITAIITTISLFFCGIPICLEIWRRKSTHEISGFPFVMGFLGGTFWLRYGLLKLDLTMITVNAVGVSLMFLYLIFYIFYSEKKTFIVSQTVAVFTIIGAMLIAVQVYGNDVLSPLGFVSMTFNIVNFGAPLAGVRVVLRKKCCDTLPLPLCTANLLVSSQWCLYGILVNDIYIIVPNGIGIILALIQLFLFLIFPRTQGGRAPCAICCPCCRPTEGDMECGQKEEITDEATATNWSNRRNTLPQKTAPRKPCTNLRTRMFGCADRSESANTGITSVAPDGSPEVVHTLSASHPQLSTARSDSNSQDSGLPDEPILPQHFEFDRIREIDDLDRQWSESEIQRVQSAPEIPRD